MNDFNNVMEKLEYNKQDTIARLEAWKKFKLVYKKDGSHFSVFSKNFECASVGKYSIIEDSEHPYLTIHYNVNARYETEHIEIYFYLDELPETDERRKEYKPQFVRQTVAMNFDEIENKVKSHIEFLENQIKSYDKQIEIAKSVYDTYMSKVTEAKNELLKNCGDKNTLYYDVLKCFNSEY